MAVTSNFDVTQALCLADLPVKADEIGAATTPVSTGSIDSWLNQASGQLWSLLNSKSITTIANDNDNAVLQRAVIAFVGSRVLAAMNRATGLQLQLWDEWQAALKWVSERPDLLGDTATASSTLSTNIDKDNPQVRKWGARNKNKDRNGFRGW